MSAEALVPSEDADGIPTVGRWRNAVRDQPTLDPTARLVALILGTYMGADANGAFPSKRTIAAGCGLSSVRTVDTAIHRLEQAGLLEVHRSKGHRPNVYRGVIPSAPECPTANTPLTRDPLAYLDE